MALYRENATGFVQEWASNPGATHTAITAQPTDTLANRVTWWRNVDKGSQASSWHPSEYRTPQDPAEAVLSMAFSKDAAFFSADSTGAVTDAYLGGSCTVSVYRGGTDVTDSEGWTLTKVDEGCTSTLTKSGGVWTLTITSVPLLATKSGYVRVTATRTGSTTQVRDWNWMKVQNGVDGVSTRLLTLSASAQVFQVAKDGTNAPASITFTALPAGALTGTATFTTSPSVTLTGTGNTRTLSYANMGANAAVTVTATLDGYSDQITVVKVGEGADAITAVLANEAHTFPAGPDGTVSSYTGSGTEIRVYAGATLLDYDATGTANGTWKVTPAAGTVGNGSNGASNITIGTYTASGTTPNRYLTVGAHAGVAAGVDLSSIDYTITGKSPNGTAFSLVKRQSFGKSKTGADGTTGTRGSRQILVTTADGVWSDLTAWNGVVTQTGTTPVLSDLVTIAKTDGSVATSKFCTGNSASPGVWTTPNAYINGSLLVTGTVGANQIAAGSITTSKLAVGSGGNIVPNSGPVLGAETVDWTLGYFNTATATGPTAGGAAERPAGGASLKVTATGANVDEIFGLQSAATFPVMPGVKYEFSAYLAGTNTKLLATKLIWCDANGNQLAVDGSGNPVYEQEGSGGNAAISTNIATWYRSTGITTPAPDNARQAFLIIRGTCASTSNPTMVASQIFVAQAGPNQTEISPWSPSGVATLIDGKGIKTGSITADRLVAGTLTADLINSGTIGASTIIMNGATSILKSSTYVAGSAGWQLNGDGSFEANSGTFKNVTVTGTLTATTTYSGTWTAANIPSLNASKITAGTIDASVIGVTNLNASNINTGTLSATRISGGTLNASLITVTNLSASSITTGTLNGTNVSVTNLNATNITTGYLDAARINAGTITAAKLSFTPVQAGGAAEDINANATTIDGSKITTGSLNANRIAAGTITADRITAGTITADRIVTGGVDTARIANNAVTKCAGVGTVVGYAITPGNNAQSAAITVNFPTAPQSVTFIVAVYASIPSGSSAYIGIYQDGVPKSDDLVSLTGGINTYTTTLTFTGEGTGSRSYRGRIYNNGPSNITVFNINLSMIAGYR